MVRRDNATEPQVKLHAEYIRNVYGIYGVPGNPTVLPPAYHDASGVDIGGVDPAMLSASPQAGLDAWVTVGPTGGAEGTIESTGQGSAGWGVKGVVGPLGGLARPLRKSRYRLPLGNCY